MVESVDTRDLKSLGVRAVWVQALQIHNHNEGIQLRYERITWKYCDGNVQYSDAWNERVTV